MPKGDGLDADASPGVGRVRKGETVPERFEAKPGDMKLVVFRWKIPLFNSPPVRAWGKLFNKGRDTGLSRDPTTVWSKDAAGLAPIPHSMYRGCPPQRTIQLLRCVGS